jgi:hypothetical protein
VPFPAVNLTDDRLAPEGVPDRPCAPFAETPNPRLERTGLGLGPPGSRGFYF